MKYGKWKYRGDDSDRHAPDGSLMLGFVYRVTEISTGRWYVGKRQMVSNPKDTRKGARKGSRRRKENDWRKYKTSSTAIVELCEEHGESHFDWEILSFHNSKSMLAWIELGHQVRGDCLRNEMSFNGIVNIRLSKIKED